MGSQVFFFPFKKSKSEITLKKKILKCRWFGSYCAFPQVTSVCQLSGQHSFVGWTTCYRERKGFLASPKENFLCGLYFYYNTHLVSSLRSPTYSVIRRSPSKWGLIIVAMLKLGFWTEIGVSFVAQFWHNFWSSAWQNFVRNN